MTRLNEDWSSTTEMPRDFKTFSKGASQTVKQVQDELASAMDRVLTLESELTLKQQAIARLLSDDCQSAEEIAGLQEVIWQSHLGLPASCECEICAEVERSRTELRGIIPE